MRIAQIVGLSLALLTSFMIGVLIWSGVYTAIRRAVNASASNELENTAPLDASASTEVQDESEIEAYNLVRQRHPFENLPVHSYAEDTIVVPVLMYHKVETPPSGAKPSVWQLYVSPTEFDHQMEYLYMAGYSVVTLEDITTALGGGTALPVKPVAITFDDLYQSQVDNALPVLAKYGFKATFFVCANCPHVKGENVKAVLAAGHTIGSHSYSHGDLTELRGAALRHEVAESRHVLESRYGITTSFFAYPGCNYDPTVEQAVINAGYLGAVTCVTPFNGQTDSGRYHLARRLIDNDYDKFIARLEDREGMW